jgi:hypothetical protein
MRFYTNQHQFSCGWVCTDKIPGDRSNDPLCPSCYDAIVHEYAYGKRPRGIFTK